MRTSKKLLIVSGALLIAGCAYHSGVVPAGQEGYYISRQAATGFTGLSTLEPEILTEAEQYCRKDGKALEVGRVDKSKPPYIFGNFPRVEVRFTCR